VITFISPHDLMPRIGAPGAPVIVDVRVADDFAEDPRLLPRSLRRAHDAADPSPPARTVVVVCRKGRKLSQGVATLLQAAGAAASVLAAGTDGWPGPTLEAGRLPENGLWATPDTASGTTARWAVRRLAPVGHRALGVAADELAAAAAAFSAAPIADLRAFLQTCGRDHPPLDRLAKAWPRLEGLVAAARTVSEATAFAAFDAAYAEVRR
jgi:rhodanese-related sulfurtransferase